MRDAARRGEFKAELLLLLVAFIWAGNYPVTKWGIAGLGIWVFNAVRFIVATGVVLVLFRMRESWVQLRLEDWRAFFRAGVVASILYQVAFIVGLSLTTAGNAAVILATAPLWTIFLQARLHRERIDRSVWIGTCLSLCGIILIVLGSGKRLEFGGTALIGDLVTLAAAGLWALNTNLQKPLVARLPPLQVTLVMLLIGAVGLSLLAVPAAVSLSWGDVTWIAWLCALASGALSIGVANAIWTLGVKRIGPGRTSNFQNVVPVLAFIISYFTLHEDLTPVHFLGAGVTIAGVWYARR
jgi:drug/metabolite transporter (DMT)-like permease